MRKNLPIGLDNYRMLKERNLYHVDKTLMIKEFLDDSGTWVTLITRPRRFGKTLNMSMMAEFFDITKDSKDIFTDTFIMETEYASYINQYPTIFISFASAKGDQKIDVIEAIKTEIYKEYKRHSIVFENLDSFDLPRYQRYYHSLQDFDNLSDIKLSLSFLMERMEAYYGKKIMLFIDEYDTPFIDAYIHGYYEEIRSSLSSILLNALKLSSSLEYALLTGIQRVANENIFSDLNNVEIYDLSSNHFSQYFGFTEDETKQMLEDYELEFNDEVKDMYDGYHIGNIDVYNPWSILKYVKSKELGYYWVNTSSNMMIKNAMRNADISFNQGFETLLEQGYLDTPIDLETSFYEESETSTLWGLFVNAGYLTIVKKLEFDELRLKIPNQEVVKEFKYLVASYLNVAPKL
ncbi:MAG: AAA family ATPase [Erysipelotrichaceae bacterium]|nr:AAA family ATPase [Erysipelotrichaceae bacterium]